MKINLSKIIMSIVVIFVVGNSFGSYENFSESERYMRAYLMQHFPQQYSQFFSDVDSRSSTNTSSQRNMPSGSDKSKDSSDQKPTVKITPMIVRVSNGMTAERLPTGGVSLTGSYNLSGCSISLGGKNQSDDEFFAQLRKLGVILDVKYL